MFGKNLKLALIALLVFSLFYFTFPDIGKTPDKTMIYIYNPYLTNISKSMVHFRVICSENIINHNLQLHMETQKFSFFKDFSITSLTENLYQDVSKFPAGRYDCFFTDSNNNISNKVKVSIQSNPPTFWLRDIPADAIFSIQSRNISLETICTEKLKKVNLLINKQIITMNNYGLSWKWDGYLPFKEGINDVTVIATNFHDIASQKLYKIQLEDIGFSQTIPVLVYHNVGYMYGSYNVTPDVFEKQIKELITQECYFIDPKELFDFYTQKINLPRNSVMITFDDGYNGILHYALPILKKYHVKATLFVTTSNIGHVSFLNWDKLDEIMKSGLFTLGSHTNDLHQQIKFFPFTITYPTLLRFYSKGETLKQYEERVLPDLKKSKEILEARYKNNIFCFAYPFGSFSIEAIQLVKKAGFTCAFSYNSSKKEFVSRNSNLYLLERYPVFQYSTNKNLITEEK